MGFALGSVLILAVFILREGDAGPVIQQTPHSLATSANSDSYLYKNKNSDVYFYRNARSAPDHHGFPAYTKLIKFPYQQNLIATTNPFSLQPLGKKPVLRSPAGFPGLKLFLSPPPQLTQQQHVFPDFSANPPPLGISTDLGKLDPRYPFNRPATIHRVSQSIPVDKPTLVNEVKSADNGVLLERLRQPTNGEVKVDKVEAADEESVRDNGKLSEAPQENSRIAPNTTNSNEVLDNVNFNNNSSPPALKEDFSSINGEDKFEPDFNSLSFTSDIKSDTDIGKAIDDFKNPEPDFDFTIPSNNSSSSSDFDFPSSNSNLEEKSRSEVKPDLLDLLDKIAKADDKHREENTNVNANTSSTQFPDPETEPHMQDRQDSSLEQPAPFFPPSFDQVPQVQQQEQPFQSNFQPTPNRFSPLGPQQPQQQQPFFPSSPQQQPSQPQFPSQQQGFNSAFPPPPQFQTSDFFQGGNQFSNQQQQEPPSNNQDQSQFSPFPGLPPAPQFQTSSFFPGHNRFRVSPNEQQQQQQQPQSNQPQAPQFPLPNFPRNLFPGGGAGSPPPEPENGYNPYHMHEQFPEPPYESEFADLPEEDSSPEQSQRSAGEHHEAIVPPPMGFAQSTLRGVQIDEILDVVQRKQVPPNCVYNTVSYGPDGEDCVESKKK